ncbi:10379_t:CDS:2 [Diversispora eburnea]|uniref:ubiquitinyl hydrolase 1 n=1 Tax=Diversispora eburnea TaxID=1213867 RepID=A0A9N9G4H6_9GLOM|nr:10379_t:CDS:2 [Diversispora eburnea]
MNTIELVPIGSEEGRESRKCPEEETAYICNLAEHWFTLRRFGGLTSRWYNLDSLLGGPERISPTYLGMLLNQLENEGYSIFIVKGTFPANKADEVAVTLPDPSIQQLQSFNVNSSYEDDLQAAIEASLQTKELSPEDLDDLRAKRLARFEKVKINEINE